MKRTYSGASDLSLLLDDFDLDFLSEFAAGPNGQGGGPKEHFQACESLCDSFFDPKAELESLERMQYEGLFLSCQSGSGFSPCTSYGDSGSRELKDNAVLLSSSLGSENDWSGATSMMCHPAGSPKDCVWAQLGSPKSGEAAVKTESGHTGSSMERAHSTPRGGPTKRGRGRASHMNPSASTLAQRRYHERQKMKKQEENRKMQELRTKMEQLVLEKRILESKNQSLVKDMLTWQSHVETLWNQEAIRTKSQIVTLQLTVELITRVSGRVLTLEEAKDWTVQEFVEHYQLFIDRQRQLCDAIYSNPTDHDIEELEVLWDMQKAIEIRGGLGSSIHLSMWAFNTRETERRQDQPSSRFWAQILDSLHLANEQVEKILSSYEWMHGSITKIMEERELQILPLLRMEASCLPREKMHCCASASRLYRSFRTEQTTVLGFEMQIDKVLTKAQKAFLECKAYPWCVEYLEICKILQQQRRRPALQFPNVKRQGLDLDIFPKATAFQVLMRTMTALGMGSRLRAGIAVCPFETVMPRPCFPNPPLERMARTKLIDAMTGRWRRYTIWQWMKKVKELGRLFDNDLVEDEEPQMFSVS